VIRSEIRDSLLVEGSDINGAYISDSIVGVRGVVRDGTRLQDVVMMGADAYEDEDMACHWKPAVGEMPPLGIGRNCNIERAIIDKDARIGDGVVIESKAGRETYQGDNHWIRDGITVIPKGAVIQPGTKI
jgi:glucose-1-phosphate adenylyltransferase